MPVDYDDITKILNEELPRWTDKLACDLMDAYLEHRRRGSEENLGTDGLAERLYNAAEDNVVKLLMRDGGNEERFNAIFTKFGRHEFNSMIKQYTGIDRNELEKLFEDVDKTDYSMIAGLVGQATNRFNLRIENICYSDINTSNDLVGLKAYVEGKYEGYCVGERKSMDTMNDAIKEYARIVELMKLSVKREEETEQEIQTSGQG